MEQRRASARTAVRGNLNLPMLQNPTHANTAPWAAPRPKQAPTTAPPAGLANLHRIGIPRASPAPEANIKTTLPSPEDPAKDAASDSTPTRRACANAQSAHRASDSSRMSTIYHTTMPQTTASRARSFPTTMNTVWARSALRASKPQSQEPRGLARYSVSEATPRQHAQEKAHSFTPLLLFPIHIIGFLCPCSKSSSILSAQELTHQVPLCQCPRCRL